MQPDYLIQLGELIRWHRLRCGLTQKDLALQLGTSQSTINRIERGRQNVSLHCIARLSDILNVSLIDITPKTRLDLQLQGGSIINTTIAIRSVAATELAPWLNLASQLGITTYPQPDNASNQFKLDFTIRLPLTVTPQFDTTTAAGCLGAVLVALSQHTPTKFVDHWQANAINRPIYQQLKTLGAHIEILRSI